MNIFNYAHISCISNPQHQGFVREYFENVLLPEWHEVEGDTPFSEANRELTIKTVGFIFYLSSLEGLEGFEHIETLEVVGILSGKRTFEDIDTLYEVTDYPLQGFFAIKWNIEEAAHIYYLVPYEIVSPKVHEDLAEAAEKCASLHFMRL